MSQIPLHLAFVPPVGPPYPHAKSVLKPCFKGTDSKITEPEIVVRDMINTNYTEDCEMKENEPVDRFELFEQGL